MPASDDANFYRMLDSIAKTTNAVEQNKRIKEAEFAEDSREPTEQEIAAIRQDLEKERESGKSCRDNPPSPSSEASQLVRNT